MIYEALQQATDARPGRRVEIVNLGLEPKEALEMGLGVEPVSRKDGRAVPVANYVRGSWRAWLQSQRVELNAMSTPQFLDWLERKILAYHFGKLIPPPSVLTGRLRREAQERSFEETRARILREQRCEEQADRDFRKLKPSLRKATRALRTHVRQFLKNAPTAWWPKVVTEVVEKVVNGTGV